MAEGSDRRTLLRALLAGAFTGPVLASCADDSRGAQARHPALAPPKDAAAVLGLDLSSAGTPGREAALALLGRIDDADQDGLMVGFGASFFENVGSPAARPAALTVMPPFVGDVLDPRRTHGDLILHVEADDALKAREQARDLLRGLGGLRVRWQVEGHRDDNRVAGGRPLVRNPFGYTEGHGNAPIASSTAAADVLTPRTSGQPDWMAGASLLAVRIVRLARTLWDADDHTRQDRIVGRRRDGRWLDGRPSISAPAFAADPDGRITPLDAHVRKVNPRTPGQPPPRMIRRSWAYTSDPTAPGPPEEGVLFMAYQADYQTGFALAQRRLRGEAMTPYLLTVGGGYFAIPARRPAGGWLTVLTGPAST